jgi:hypothetical protein
MTVAAHNKTDIPPKACRETLENVLEWSQARDYAGHSKHDALNSPFLNGLTLNTKLLRLVAIQSIMRFPFNMRSALGVPRLRNPKGIGLFAHAYLDFADYLQQNDTDAVRAAECIAEAEKLLSWLVHTASPWTAASDELKSHFSIPDQRSPLTGGPANGALLNGLGWGYHYPWQDVGFFQPRHFPNRVVSSWIGFAFIRAYEVTRETRYLDAAGEIAAFLLNNPKRIVDHKDQLCLSYVPIDNIEWAVMDVSALVAALVMKVIHHGGRVEGATEDPTEQATRLMRFVINKQTDYGAWFYTWPSKGSHITHDNYHTGIILDCLADFMSYRGNHEYTEQYKAGLEFYRQQLFQADGAPRWMNNKTYPHDIHGAAAGILCFERAARYFKTQNSTEDSAVPWHETAARIREWTLQNLYSDDGYFYYQKTHCYTKRFNLMRWANAWMCRALAQSL